MRKYRKMCKRNPGIREEEGNRTEPLMIPREVIEREIFNDVWTLGAFIDLVRLTNTRQTRVMWFDLGRTEIRFTKSGQLYKPLAFFEKRWGITATKLLTFFDSLEREGLVKIIKWSDQETEAVMLVKSNFTEWEWGCVDSFHSTSSIRIRKSFETNGYQILFNFFVPLATPGTSDAASEKESNGENEGQTMPEPKEEPGELPEPSNVVFSWNDEIQSDGDEVTDEEKEWLSLELIKKEMEEKEWSEDEDEWQD